jgi:GT2 family glycosyltransferase
VSDTVLMAYCHDGRQVAYAWHKSVVDLIGYDLSAGQHVIRGGFNAMRCGTLGLIDGRDEVATRMLDDDAPDWLWWIDTDMGFAPDTVERLLAAADPVERPIVGALCFAQREHAQDGHGGWLTAPMPTIYDWAKRASDGKFGTAVRWDYPRDTLTRCIATGSACVLIHRDVFAKIHAEHDTWYERLSIDGIRYSEDISFCLRAGMLEIPIHVDTRVKTTHMKTQWVGEHGYTGRPPGC